MVGPTQLDVIIHPVRSRILSVVTDRTTTATAIADLLPDVPRPSVYRHVNKMIAAGILRIVRETKVRGATEKWLEVCESRTQLKMEDLRGMSDEQRWALVNNLLMMLSADYRNAVQRTNHTLPVPLICSVAINLNEKERKEFWQEMLKLVQRYRMEIRPEGRELFSFGCALLPDLDREPS